MVSNMFNLKAHPNLVVFGSLQVSILNDNTTVVILWLTSKMADDMIVDQRWPAKFLSMQTRLLSFSKFSKFSSPWFNLISYML